MHECAALYRTYHSPEHIQSHMRVVTTLATKLANARQQIGDTVSVPLIEAAALLHDLVRTKEQWPFLPPWISTPLPHAEINYLLLRDEFPEVASVIHSHSLMSILDPTALSSWEHKIVYYADKRVNHSTVVSLEDRIALGRERWNVTTETDRSTELIPLLYSLERELFTDLTIQPNNLHA